MREDFGWHERGEDWGLEDANGRPRTSALRHKVHWECDLTHWLVEGDFWQMQRWDTHLCPNIQVVRTSSSLELRDHWRRQAEISPQTVSERNEKRGNKMSGYQIVKGFQVWRHLSSIYDSGIDSVCKKSSPWSLGRVGSVAVMTLMQPVPEKTPWDSKW